ncbi:MAG: hypothetical protein HC906_15020 [Bacteroidales bacterium]|nr:hypothetical protein [Bacteroidales bacterium]
MLKFFIKDSGSGIPKEMIDDIFKSFNKYEDASQSFVPGIGLGLTISKKMVNVLGGEIWVDSVVGQGSVFSFIIPFYSTKSKKSN